MRASTKSEKASDTLRWRHLSSSRTTAWLQKKSRRASSGARPYGWRSRRRSVSRSNFQCSIQSHRVLSFALYTCAHLWPLSRAAVPAVKTRRRAAPHLEHRVDERAVRHQHLLDLLRVQPLETERVGVHERLGRQVRHDVVRHEAVQRV